MKQVPFFRCAATPAAKLVIVVALFLNIMGGGNVLMGQGLPLPPPPEPYICQSEPYCATPLPNTPCTKICLSNPLQVWLHIVGEGFGDVWPSALNNPQFAAKFIINHYSVAASFETEYTTQTIISSPNFGLYEGWQPYPLPFIFSEPGIYEISVGLWQDTDADGILDVETAYDPDVFFCIQLNDSQLTQDDISITPQLQQQYCLGETLNMEVLLPTAYETLQWYVGNELICTNPWNPAYCQTFEMPLNQVGNFTVTLVAYSTNCLEQNLIFEFSVIDCCPPNSPVFNINTPQELQCCMEAANFTLSPASAGITAFEGRPAYIVPASSTWSNTNNDFIANFGAPAGPTYLNVDLVIPSGVTLNISNMDIYFGNSCRILVQPNANLVINQPASGATLFAGICNAMWQGIQVEGPGGSVARQQDPISGALNFGTVYMTGNVQVTDALFGIIGMKLPLLDINTVASELTDIAMFSGSTFFPSISSQILFTALNSTTAQSSSGGMLFVENGATLHNCLEGVNMSWHTAGCNLTLPNPTLPAYIGCQNRIQNANFTATQLLYPFNATGSPVNITEAGIHTIRYLPQANQPLLILGNSFNNLRYAARSIAIDNTSYRSNNIDNCEVGISIANLNFGTAIFDNLNVVTNQFNNCNISLQAARTRLLIDGNLINNNYTPPSMSTANPIGMFLQGSDFEISDNNINYTRCAIALLSNDADANTVNSNTIDACGIGVWTLGNNTGTQITCNQISNYAIALCAQDYTQPPAETGDLDDQGDCNPVPSSISLPADNLFQLPITYGSFTGYEIVAAIPPANNFIYWYRNQPGYIPQLFAGEVTPTGCFSIISAEENCSAGQQLLPDSDIKALADERLLNTEAIKKVRYYLYEAEDTLAAKNLLEDINTDMSRRFLIPYYIIQANLGTADSLLATLPDERTQDLHYRWLYGIYSNLRHSGRDITDINTGEEDTIRLIATTYTKAAFEARSILYLLYGEEYPLALPNMPTIIDPAMIQGVAINFKNGQINLNGNDYIVSKPYPNPANTTINISTRLNNGDIAIFRLFDFTGRIVLESPLPGAGQYAFKVSHLPSGVYFYQVLLNSEGLFKGKLILTN